MKNNNIKKRVLVLTFTGIMGVAMLSGYGKQANCDISQKHLHEYVNDEGYVSYIDSEKMVYKGLHRLDDNLIVDEEEARLRSFENTKGLYRISENQDVIDSVEISSRDYPEYRYSYTYQIPIPHIINNGKTSVVYYTYIPATGYSWTSDPTHYRLTGEQRVVHNVYQGFKIEKDKRGKYVLIGSEYVDSINELSSEYKYIKNDFHKQIDIKDGELDYEDGPEENHQLPDAIERGNEISDNIRKK